MEIGTEVEYETGYGEVGNDEVVAIDEETELLTVKYIDDGTTWCGPADRATPVDE